MKQTKLFLLAMLSAVATTCCFVTSAAAQERTLAFPGAEGYGKYTVGGRGGKVIEVTNLNDAGPGSLRAAISEKEPRTIVFKVSGDIELKSSLNIRNPYVTIAGQTAPGDGICLKNYGLSISADQVIIRYIRVRIGDRSGLENDAIGGRYHKNIILDHISASWSVDETMSLYHCDSVTVQWCMITESMYNSNHVKGVHGFGGIWGSNHGSYHHNLIAHHSSRNPRIASGCGYFDYRNNVIYNWGYNSCYGGENQQKGALERNFSCVNIVGNYYKPGPATIKGEIRSRIASPGYRDVTTDYGRWFISGNYMDGNAEVTKDNWQGVHPSGGAAHKSFVKAEKPWDAMPINEQTAEKAYKSVLQSVGASLHRDAVDARIIKEVRTGTATYEGKTYKSDRASRLVDASLVTGIIDTQSDVGGWPALLSLAPATDTDHDGMPDEWELQHGLNPNDASDGAKVSSSGYTNLENYMNSLTERETSGIKKVTAAANVNECGKPRIVVLTDSEIDDRCSMVHLLLCSNDVDIAAIIQTNSCFQRHGWSNEHWLEKMIGHYAEVYANLKVHTDSYPTPEFLLSKVFVGDEDPKHVCLDTPASNTLIGKGAWIDPREWDETPGSKELVKILLDSDPRPVYIQAWGGGNTAAKAFQILRDRYPEEYERAASKAIMYNIWYQDAAGNYIEQEHPLVTMLVSYHFHGTWDYGAQNFVSQFVRTQMHESSCSLARDYVQNSISEGDSPAFLYCLDNGLRSYEHPTYGGWGGQFYKASNSANVYRDTDKGSYSRWMEYALRDFQSRLVWATTPRYEDANHAPKVNIAEGLDLTVKGGEKVTLTAEVEDDNFIDIELQWLHRQHVSEQKGGTKEKFIEDTLKRPQKFEIAWWQFYEAGTLPVYVDLYPNPKNSNQVSFMVPKVSKPETLHIIFQTTDNNKMGLTGFARVIINILP